MKLLAIETATDACSCALVLDGEQAHRREVAPRRHAELVLGMVSELLDSGGVTLSSLDAIAFGRGPGSFTGVRIATAVAQGLGFAADLPLVPVSSLGALALAAGRRHQVESVLAAFDARMGEVYWGAFDTSDSTMAIPKGEERVLPPGEVPIPAEGDWFGAGGGWLAHRRFLVERMGGRLVGVDVELLPGAGEVASIAGRALREGRCCAPEEARPVYLRNRVADPRAGPRNAEKDVKTIP